MKFCIFLILSTIIYPYGTLDLSFGEVGIRDKVYSKLMEHVVGFEDPRFFGQGLEEAVQRAIENSRIIRNNLKHEDLEIIEKSIFSSKRLYDIKIAFHRLKNSMNNHRKLMIRKGLWQDPKPIHFEISTVAKQLTCCGNFIHESCVEAHLKHSPDKKCPFCRNEIEHISAEQPSGTYFSRATLWYLPNMPR